MTSQPTSNLPPIGAILTGPHWPDRVRVVRAEPRGAGRVLIEAVTLDGQDRLLSRLFKTADLAGLQVEIQAGQPSLSGDPAGLSPGGRGHPHPPGLHLRSPVCGQPGPNRSTAPPARSGLSLYAPPAPAALPAGRRPRCR